MTAFTLERLSGSERAVGAPTAAGVLRRMVSAFGRVVGSALRAGAGYEGATSNAARREVLERFARS